MLPNLQWHFQYFQSPEALLDFYLYLLLSYQDPFLFANIASAIEVGTYFEISPSKLATSFTMLELKNIYSTLRMKNQEIRSDKK